MTFKFRKGLLIYMCILLLISMFCSYIGIRQVGLNVIAGLSL
jgi:hypothetical protein